MEVNGSALSPLLLGDPLSNLVRISHLISGCHEDFLQKGLPPCNLALKVKLSISQAAKTEWSRKDNILADRATVKESLEFHVGEGTPERLQSELFEYE